MKPRFRILTDQNRIFKNKLVQEPDVQGLNCKLCNMDFPDEDLLADHCATRTHFLRKIYRTSKYVLFHLFYPRDRNSHSFLSYRKSFLTKIESLEINSSDEMNFQIHQESRVEIVFKNIGTESHTITFHRVEVLNEIQYITLIHDAPKTIKSGKRIQILAHRKTKNY